MVVEVVTVVVWVEPVIVVVEEPVKLVIGIVVDVVVVVVPMRPVVGRKIKLSFSVEIFEGQVPCFLWERL
jgi:hypothetical protein